MIRRLIILLLIIGCEKDTVAPESEPSICDELTEVELWGEYYDIATTASISLYSQGLTDSIPPEIGCLTNLISLNLRDNQLTGEISSSIGNLTNLTYLWLFNNQLTGEIPPWIGNLTSLTDLRLSLNQLTGEIPPEIGNLTNLNYLYLYSNQLTGEILPEICNVYYISVGNNQLCPPYPDCISQQDIDSQDTSNCP